MCYRRIKRPATQLSNLKRQLLLQRVWNQVQCTSSKSEHAQQQAMVSSVEDLSLKPPQCVSHFNYCQLVFLEWLPEKSQWINTSLGTLSVSLSIPLSQAWPPQVRSICLAIMVGHQVNTSVPLSLHLVHWEMRHQDILKKCLNLTLFPCHHTLLNYCHLLFTYFIELCYFSLSRKIPLGTFFSIECGKMEENGAL
jgi:hypothetical protein